MEGDAIGYEAELLRFDREAEGHAGVAAELAREGPVGTFTIEDDAEVDERARGALGHVLQVLVRVAGVELHAVVVGERDLFARLDRIAVADPVTRDTEAEQLLDLGPRGDVEVRATLIDRSDHLVERTRLDGVEDAGAGHRADETVIGRVDALDVDDEAGALLFQCELLHALEIHARDERGGANFVFH